MKKKTMKKQLYLLLMSLSIISCTVTEGVIFKQGEGLTFVIEPQEAEMVHTAIGIFSKDYKAVFGGEVSTEAKSGDIYVGTIGQNSPAEEMTSPEDVQALAKHTEGFLIFEKNDKLVVLGSDKHGTAYGILELSRLIGVSPWEWWADSAIEKLKTYTFSHGFRKMKSPSVAYRGIFINDEDWGLMPWSSKNYEPAEQAGKIGPRTNERIFELLLRLRANSYWPAMHECSIPFFMTEGNREVAKKYGIFIGSSHCEPMACNAAGEWRRRGVGDYDYVNNSTEVYKFWENRVQEVARQDVLYTIGMRGVHDGKMQGAETVEEQKNVLNKVFTDQRGLLKKYVNEDVTQVPQVFIPYKEVLDVYHAGLKVPEDVALMWCDDNYGYIRHFPTEEERARKGGNGVYYHVSYWGRPHDYLWLATNHPAQLYTQMKMAYDKGIKDLWILNVGDIKPGEYLIELFMDMAWNINGIENNINGLDKHLYNWLSREFGEDNAKEILPVMNEFYRLAYIRKPEYMGNTRTEEKDPAYKIVSDLPWSENYINQRIKEYKAISEKVQEISKNIPAAKQATWFQLVEYPVRGAAEMNFKHLYGQLARHGKADWAMSDSAYEEILSLTEKYNSLSDGKWRYIMDCQPRELAVFAQINHSTTTSPLVEEKIPAFLFNGSEYQKFQGDEPIVHGLGYERKAISLMPDSEVSYEFESSTAAPISVEISLAPNHPVEGKTIRYAIAIDDEPVQIVDYHTEGRSEEWKINNLRNQAIRTTEHVLRKSGKHTLSIKALDEGVVVDQIKIWE